MKKLLACVFMTFDHVGMYYRDLMPTNLYVLFRLIGCMAMPLFAHEFAVGFLRTRDTGKYFLRLAVFASLAQAILCMFFPLSGSVWFPLPLNSLYVLLFGFGVLYGIEVLISKPPQKIASLRLINANAETKSDRFDLRIGEEDGTTRPLGLRIPPWPFVTMQIISLSLIVLCVTLPVFIPMEYGLFGVLTVLMFYSVERWVSGSKAVAAFICFMILNFAFMLISYRSTGELDLRGASIAAVFLCFLPTSDKRPSRLVQYAFYLYFPLHILILMMIRIFLIN
jgi:hypothetical protein